MNKKNLLILLSFLITPLAITASDAGPGPAPKRQRIEPSSAASAASDTSAAMQIDDDSENWDQNGDAGDWEGFEEEGDDTDDNDVDMTKQERQQDVFTQLVAQIQSATPDLEIIKSLILREQRTDPNFINQHDQNGKTLLIHAVIAKNLNLVKQLINLNADTNKVHAESGKSPLEYAHSVAPAIASYLENLLHEQEAKQRSQTESSSSHHGGDQTAACQDYAEWQALHETSPEDEQIQYAQEALFTSMKSPAPSSDDIAACIAQGASLTKPDTSGQTALHMAISKKSPIFDFLVANVSLNEAEATQLAHLAFDRDNSPALISLLQHYPKVIDGKQGVDQDTLQHKAAARGNMHYLQLLADAGASLTCYNGHGSTPLHFAVSVDCREVIEYILKHIKQGDLNRVDNNGKTALVAAIEHDKPHLVQLLLEAQASPKPIDHKGLSALGHAVKRNKPAIATLLIQHKAQLTSGAQPPLVIAALQKDIPFVQLLLTHKATLPQEHIRSVISQAGETMTSLLITSGRITPKDEQFFKDHVFTYNDVLRHELSGELEPFIGRNLSNMVAAYAVHPTYAKFYLTPSRAVETVKDWVAETDPQALSQE